MINTDLTFAVVILARGGSRRIPKKNIQLLNGYPLIFYPYRAAQESRYLHGNNIFLSTDDKEVREVAESFGMVVVDRPKKYATDLATSTDALKHFAKTHFFDVFVLLQPSVPTVTGKLIDKAIEHIIKHDCDVVLSVKPATSRKLFWYLFRDGAAVPWFTDFMTSQEFDSSIYEEDGSVYVFQRHAITNSFRHDYYVRAVINKSYSIDIDTEEDLRNARKFFEERK